MAKLAPTKNVSSRTNPRADFQNPGIIYIAEHNNNTPALNIIRSANCSIFVIASVIPFVPKVIALVTENKNKPSSAANINDPIMICGNWVIIVPPISINPAQVAISKASLSAFFICSSNPFEATFIAPTVRNKNVDNATVNPISAPKLSITNVPAAVPISNIIEAKSRGAKIITIRKESINIDKNVSDYDIVVPLTSEYCQNLVLMVACQLLAYNVAKLNKCDIDKPRNLAKSVTVE